MYIVSCKFYSFSQFSSQLVLKYLHLLVNHSFSNTPLYSTLTVCTLLFQSWLCLPYCHWVRNRSQQVLWPDWRHCCSGWWSRRKISAGENWICATIGGFFSLL